MTSPIGNGGDEWDLSNLPSRGRSGSVSEDAWWDLDSMPQRGRSAAIDAGHLAAANAQNRLGIIWLFSKIELGVPEWSYGTRDRSDAIVGPPTKWAIVADKISGWVRDLVNYIKQKLESVMKVFDDHGPEIIGGAYVATLIATTLQALYPAWQEAAKAAAPIVGELDTFVTGVGTTFTASKALFDTWITSSCAAIVDGAPSVIVETLRGTMKRSLAKGLYDTISSGLKITGAFITAGTSSVAEKVVGVIAKIITKIVTTYLNAKEESLMKKFLGEAELAWINRDASDAIHKDHKKFVDWYKPVAVAAPCIAAITLLSHICGDKVAYLAMYQDRLESVSQSAFEGSVSALDALKPWAKEYVTERGFPFATSDRMVRALLQFPMTPPTDMATTIMSEAEVASISTRARH
jgi:hypothetical protein